MLKALLAARGVDYPKTHNLRVLVELIFAEGIQLPEKLADIDRLTQFGTTFRTDSISFADGRDRVIWLPRGPRPRTVGSADIKGSFRRAAI